MNLTTRIMRLGALAGAAAVLLGLSAEAATLRIGTVLAPDDPMGQGLDRLAGQVAERSKGAVKIEVFHASQLGDTGDMLDQARAGANVGTVTDVARLASFVPELSVMSAPYVFDKFEDADTFSVSPEYLAWGERLGKEAGLVMLASNWYQGARNVLAQKPVMKPADLQGVKMRTIGAPVWVETISAMGATPVPMAWSEVYSALQLKVLDGAEAQPTAIWGAKLHEVISDVTLTGHIQLITALVVSKKSWDELTAEQQKMVREESVTAGRWASQLSIKLGEEAMAKVKAAGVKVHEIDTAPFKAATAGVYKKLDLEDEVAVVRKVLGK